MDFKTKPASREDIRGIAKIVRKIFEDCISEDGLYVDAIKCLELVHEKFKEVSNITVEICEDEELGNNPGRCTPDFEGNYHIQIKESVYERATNGSGGDRMHIMHEISHPIMCIFGYTPILNREFLNKELKAFESMEWQAKALAGEIMMDYDKTRGMSVLKLQSYCGVSLDAARYRKNNYNY